jgi:hypothetical protein
MGLSYKTGAAKAGIKTGQKSLGKVFQDWDAAKLDAVRQVAARVPAFAVERSPVDTGSYKRQWEVVTETGAAAGGGKSGARYNRVLGASQTAGEGSRRVATRLRLREDWKRRMNFFPETKLPPGAAPIRVKFFNLSGPFREELRAALGISDGELKAREAEAQVELGRIKPGANATIYFFNPSPHAKFVENGNGKTKGARVGAKTRQFLNRELKKIGLIKRP